MRRMIILTLGLLAAMSMALPAFAGSVTADSKCSADAISGTSFDADGARLTGLRNALDECIA